MATIDRRNILNLIGKHRDKYHSCILTCYNFDFSFFEERVLPILRTANIKNVNVLADGNYLEQAQEMTTGKEFKFNKTYNFLPVYEKGVFHPKIMLLTGLKHGLLIIGSGNITSSGLSTNDEIWGAFHLDNKENENAALFAAAWKYLQTFTAVNYGFLPQKIEWIKKYSPWLEALPQVQGPIELPSINQNIQFLSNSKGQSIYQQLLAAVPSDNLKSLTVVSPYYDKKGALLTQLLNDYKPPIFNCIVDTNSGIMPSELGEDEKKRINFYNWQKHTEGDHIVVNRLHAKLFHFEYSDGSEKMLLGSANASIAAMGGSTIPAVNAEASVLISRNQSGNWLEELNITLTNAINNISEFKYVTGLDSSTQRKSNLPLCIFYSEIKGSEINCYLNKAIDEQVSLVIVSRDGTIGETVPVTFSEKVATAKIADADAIFKVYLINTNGERLSSYSIVHRLEMLLRCNPDPTQEKFNALLEQDFSDGDGVTDLLEFVDYNWADDDSENTLDTKTATGGNLQNSKNEKEEKTYQTLTAEAFNTVDESVLLKQSGLLSSVNIKLADFLNLVLSGNDLKESDYNESEEQKLLEDEEQKGEGLDVQTKTKPKVIALEEKQALHRYFAKLEHLYANKLSHFYKAKVLTVTPEERVTIKSISKILIALQLVQIYKGKKFITQLDEKDETSIKEEKYLLDGTIYDKSDYVKGFLINAFGKFLLLATAGMHPYEYAILNEKMNHYQKQVFEKALFILLDLNCKSEEELKYRLTLLLNLHYYILPNNGTDWFDNSKERIDNIIKAGKFSSTYLNDNLAYYQKQFLPNYERWLSRFKSDDRLSITKEISQINLGDIIFNSKIGFNHIHKISNRNPYVFDFKRAGYELSEQGYIMGNITFGNKYIQYK